MATKILDLEVQQIPTTLSGLEGYENALILLRLDAQPIGQVSLPVIDGRIDGRVLRETLPSAVGWTLWEQAWMQNFLKPAQFGSKKFTEPAVTVAICTRDRTEDLKACLASLMKLPDDGQELLVVDNCPSTDATKDLVACYPGVRYIRENRLGLDCARNRALREAQQSIVAFIDDDAVADANWLRAIVPNFSDPLVLCTTGLTLPLELETEAQELFERMGGFSRGFERKVFGLPRHNPLAAGAVGAGVNMALRREVLQLVGPFDEALDAGTPTHSGGDHDMFSRIMLEGYRIVYDPAALTRHRHRRTKEELRRTVYGYGVGVYATLTRHLLLHHEWGAFRIAWKWFRLDQGPKLARSLRRRSRSLELRLILDELRGCCVGPWAYLRSRRQLSRNLPSRAKEDQFNQSQHPEVIEAPRTGISHEPAAGTSESSTRQEARAPETLVTLGAPEMSVIIPTHNRGYALKRTLDALRAQTCEAGHFEVIIVADGCTDGTVALLQQYEAPFTLRAIEQPGSGPATARNNGASQARGRLLVFLDDDIEASPFLLEAHQRAHEHRSGCVSIGYLPPDLQTQKGFFRGAIRSWWEDMFNRMRQPGHRFAYTDLLSGNFALEAKLFAQVGGFNTELWCHEDYELGVRLIQDGADFTFVEAAMGRHHELTDLKRVLWRKFEEGRADVLLGQLHPELRAVLPMSRMFNPRSSSAGRLNTFILARPSLGDRLTPHLLHLMNGLEFMRMRRHWHQLLDRLMAYWYQRGVLKELDGKVTAHDFVHQSTLPVDEKDGEMEIDLREGLQRAEQRLDDDRPASVFIRYGEQVVGRIDNIPGSERLRGAQLRPTLAKNFVRPLLVAMAIENATHLT